MEGPPIGYARAAIREPIIPYRPRYTELTGRVTAAILLQQIAFYWEDKRKPFYKFRAPCSHELYKEGDSWMETLGFSGAEFDTALKTIGTKLLKGTSKKELLSGTAVENLVIYWTDSGRVTWYELNVPLFDKLTNPLYEQEPNSRNSNYLIEESAITEFKKVELPIPEIPEIPKRPPPNDGGGTVNISRLLRATRTQGEDDPISRSSLADYIGQQLNSPVPSGQCNKLALGYTEQLPGGRQRKHPSPDELWSSHPRFPEYVDERIAWAKGQGGSPAVQRKRAVNGICKYKGHAYAWLEWLAKQKEASPAAHFKMVETYHE